jgi:hypothetical protein
MLDATVIINDDQNHPGTGILVSHPQAGGARIFMVTATHVVRLGVAQPAQACRFELRRDIGGVIQTVQVHVPLAGAAVHPIADYDLVAIEITAQVAGFNNHAHQFLGLDSIADAQLIALNGVGVSDRVYVPCFPARSLGGGFSVFGQGVRQWPVLRDGMLATSPDETLHYPDGDLNIRGMVIDCFVTPAASGSGVFLARDSLNADGAVGIAPEPLLLGILTKNEWAPLKVGNGQIKTYSGLGVALAGTIIKQFVAAL